MNLKTVVVTLWCLVCCCALAQWGRDPIPGSSGEALALLTDGRVVVAGITNEDKAGVGALDVFVAWMSAEGELERLVRFGSAGEERVGGLLVGPGGELYLAGDTTGRLDGALGEGAQFVARLSQEGELEWVRHLGGASSFTPPGLAFDGGELVVAGSVLNGDGEQDREAGWQPYYDVVVTRLSRGGKDLGSVHFALDANQTGTGVVPVGDGELVVLGLRSTEGFSGHDARRMHGFAARLSADGELGANVYIGHVGDATWPLRGAPYGEGDVALVTASALGFGEPEDGPGRGSSFDAVVGVLGGNLEPAWFRSIGALRGYVGNGVAVTGAGEVIIAGAGHQDIGGLNQGYADVFLGLYSPTGERVWVKQFGTPGRDRARDVAVSDGGVIYVAGHWDAAGNQSRNDLGFITYVGRGWFLAALDLTGELLWNHTFKARATE